MPGFWDDAEVIHRYTREQAIADGVIVPVEQLVPDEPDFASQAGWKIPVALTPALAAIVRPTERERDECMQDMKGRLWDVLYMGFVYVRKQMRYRPDVQELVFPTIFWLVGREEYGEKRQRTLHLKARVGAGDEGEPTLLIGLRGEDLS
jgi:uncharacterized protein DUF6573